MKPSKISKDQAKKILKVLVYVALSGAISALIAFATDNKESIGVLYPIVNLVLVSLKQVFTNPES
jgi:hypothetical protein